MKSLTTLIIGVASGIYIDQNYNVPKIQTFVTYAIDWARALEEKLRKDQK